MIGQTISHYKILQKLGEGGMGIVYKAQDLKLDRYVALKFLPQHLTDNKEAKKRFVQEAKAASAMDHPNVCNIYEIDETPDGHMFIAMACYEGESLRDRLKAGPMEVETALNIISQVATGLSKAHEKDIVHRDIKPANILITSEGVVKILDFGLAKLEGRTKVTKTGTTVGTVAYMSPEQARSETVDHRTDIWSLGVVLYEMLTGQKPFPGEHEAAVVYKIVNEEPPPLAQHAENLPQGLQNILDRALKKDPEERFQSVKEMLNEITTSTVKVSTMRLRTKPNAGKILRTLITIIAAVLVVGGGYLGYRYLRQSEDQGKPPVRTAPEFVIAVAPFWGQNKAATEEGIVTQNLLMRELNEIVSSEKKANILAVDPAEIPRSHLEAKTLGRNLGALMVVWGNVLIYEGEVEIQPYISIVEPLKDSFDRSSDSFKFRLSDQDQLKLRKEKAREIGNTTLFAAARYFQETNPGRALSIVQKLPETDIERFILQGNILRGMGETDDAIEAYKMASDLAPASARPHLYLGDIYRRSLQRFDEALTEYKKAIELKPDYSWARLDLADFYTNFDGMKELALNEIEKVIALGPEDAATYDYIGYLYKNMGMYDSAINYYTKATTLAPGSANIICSIGDVYERIGDFEKAIAEYKKASDIAPLDTWPHKALGHCYASQKRYEEALGQYQIALELAPDDFSTYFSIGGVHAKLGDKQKAVEYFNMAVEYMEEFMEGLGYLFLGVNYLGVGMYGEAIAEFQKGIAGGYYLNDYHYYSGYTYERMGRFEDALDEYKMGVEAELQDSLKLTIRNHLHYFLSLCRLDRQSEARSFMIDLSEKYKNITWKWTAETDEAILDFYSGRTTAIDLLNTKDEKDSKNKISSVPCILHYYIAMSYVINISDDMNTTTVDEEKALEHLQKFSEFCADWEHMDSAIWGRVESELERLKQK